MKTGTKGQRHKGTKQKNHYIPLSLCPSVPLSLKLATAFHSNSSDSSVG